MEQHEAVSKMMSSIKTIVFDDDKKERAILEKYYPLLRDSFRQLYVVGWEAGIEYAYSSRKKVIGQFNKEGKLINTFKGKKEACKKTGFAYTQLRSALERGSVTRQGWTWKYIEAKEEAIPKNNLFSP